MGQKYIIQGGRQTKMTQVPVMEKVSFGTPFAGNSVNKTLTPAELVRALRFAIAAEYEAIQLYEQIAESTDYTPAGVALMSIAREERVHAGELLEVLKTLDPEEKITYEEGEEEIEEVVGKCRKMLKGGPGSGPQIGGGSKEEAIQAYSRHAKERIDAFRNEVKNKNIKAPKNIDTRDATYTEDANRNPKDFHPEHPDNKSSENTDLTKGGPGSGRYPLGSHMQVSEGSGLASGKTVTIVNRSEIKTRGDGVPTNIQGAYKPVDWKREIPVKYADGSYDTIPKGSLTPVKASGKSQAYWDSLRDPYALRTSSLPRRGIGPV